MERIIQMIHGIPIIEAKSSEAGILSSLANDAEGGVLYFGTGLTTSRAMSVGVPFDLLGLLLVADIICRELKLSRVIQLIADTHAKSNIFTNNDEVDAMAALMKNVSTRVANFIGLSQKYTVLKSSEFDQKPEYQEIFNNIVSDDHEYVRREWSDIEYMRREYRLVLKLSWIVDPKAKKVGFDERLYDLRFRDVVGQNMSFIYVNPGYTFDPNRMKVSPYITILGEHRVIFSPKEDVRKKFMEAENKFGADKLKETRKHLAQIVAMCEDRVGAIANSNTELEEKVQLIIGKVFS